MTCEPAAVPTLWWTVAVNLSALLLAVLGVALGDGATWPLWIPVASVAVSGATGAVCLARQDTRRFGLRCLGGTAVSALVYLAALVIFVVTYFVVPGGHELS